MMRPLSVICRAARARGKNVPLVLTSKTRIEVGFLDFYGRDADDFDAGVGDNDVDAAKALDRFSK